VPLSIYLVPRVHMPVFAQSEYGNLWHHHYLERATAGASSNT
jgi:hypothetical protein